MVRCGVLNCFTPFFFMNSTCESGSIIKNNNFWQTESFFPWHQQLFLLRLLRSYLYTSIHFECASVIHFSWNGPAQSVDHGMLGQDHVPRVVTSSIISLTCFTWLHIPIHLYVITRPQYISSSKCFHMGYALVSFRKHLEDLSFYLGRYHNLVPLNTLPFSTLSSCILLMYGRNSSSSLVLCVAGHFFSPGEGGGRAQ